MKQSIKKVLALVLSVAMFMSMTTGFAATVVEGNNGKTIYFAFEYYDEYESGKLTQVTAGENFCLYVNYSGNPAVADDSIQGYNLLIGYDVNKVSFTYGEGSYEGVVHNPSLLTPSYSEGVALVQGVANGGIKKLGSVVTSGALFKLYFTAKTNLTQQDLNAIALIETTGLAGKEDTYVIDGNVPAGDFKVVQAPAISVGQVVGDIYSDTSAADIKGMIQSFSFISASGAVTTYTSNDSEWAGLSVSLPTTGLVVGKNTLAAHYGDYDCEFEVTVLDRVESIAITTAPDKVNYNAFETFDKAGMVVTATYESTNTEDVTADCVVDTTTPLQVSDTSWTVTYAGKSASQPITVAPLSVTAPVASSEVLTYNGSVQNFAYTNDDAARVTVTGTTSGKDAGSYTATAALNDKTNTAWATGGTNDVQLSWTINKADVTGGIAPMTKKYTTTYASLPTQADVTGVNSETVSADISWYTDAACTQPASANSQIASITDVGVNVTLYYKATGMSNYNDYNGFVLVGITDKDAGTVSVGTLPSGLTASGATIAGTYSEAGYTLAADAFTVAAMGGASLGAAQNVSITKDGSPVDRITDAGTYTVTVSYEDNDNKAQNVFTVEIAPKSIEGAKVSLKIGEGNATESTSANPATVVYTGSVIVPEVTGVEGITANDYVVDAQAQGTTTSAKDVSGVVYSIAVNGTGNYTGTVYGYWKITPAEINLSAATVADKVYNGTANDASVTSVSFSGLLANDTLENGVDYDVTSAVYADNNVSDNAVVDVTVALKNTVTNYTLNTATVQASGKITKAAAPSLSTMGVQTLLSSAVVTGAKDYSFNLAEIISGIPADKGDVTYAVKTEGTFVKNIGTGIEGASLKVNVAEAQAAGVTDSVLVTVSSTNYEDADVYVDFKFKNKLTVTVSISDVDITYGDTYTVAGGYANQPADGYTWSYSYVGIEGTDYPATDVQPTKAGKYSVTARYEDNVLEGVIPGHIGEATATITISKKALTLANGDVVVTKVYDGTTDSGTLSGALALSGAAAEDEVSVDMTNATIGAYTASDVGTYTVEIGGLALAGADKDNYSIPSTYSFADAKITKQLQSAVTINGSNENISATYGDSVSLVVAGGNGTGAYALTSSDTTVLGLTAAGDGIWQAQILKPGTVTLTASKQGDDNYEASSELAVTFTISPKAIAEGDFEFDLEDKVFTGSEIKPAVTSQTLSSTTDYDVAYTNNVNKGTAAITVTGKGNYTDTVEKTFEITAKALNETEFAVSGLSESYTYTGAAIAPSVNVAWGTIVLVNDTDYEVAYTDNTNAGTATVTITGKGNYSETLAKTFEITPAAYTGTVGVTSSDATVAENTVLTANPPAGDVLVYQWKRNGEDIADATANTYTVVAADLGAEITVAVTSTGNYVGTLESGVIEVGKAHLTGTVTLALSTDITATIEGAPAEENYSIVWLRDGSEVSGVTGTTYTVTAADKGCAITMKLVAVGDSYTGEIVSNAIAIPAEAPSFAQAPTVTAGNTTLTVSYSANENGSQITNYEIMVDGNVVATLPGTQTSYVITGLTNGTQYTVKVVAINGMGNAESAQVTGTPVAPVSGGGGGGVASYKVTANTAEGGKVTTSVKNATAGSTVTIKVTPDEGYEVAKVTVLDNNGAAVEVTEKGSDYTFKMPKTAVTIDVEFAKKAEDGTDEGKDDEPQDEPGAVEFSDVKSTAYYFDAVKWAVENNVTSGTGANSFSPNAECTRAQMVTFLWRAAGSPKAQGGENPFSDIATDSYYYDAVMWAVENGITSGATATTFDPNGRVSRAQSVTFMWRLAKAPAADAENAFTDVAGDAYYSAAVTWAVNENVTYGLSATSFGPNDACTRAQIVTFIHRYFVK